MAPEEPSPASQEGQDGSRENPYVGPRPFEPGERLYGRDREIRDLDNLLSAERIVLLHSPSGAGKSSMMQAGLLPRLKRFFDIWGPTRVNQEPAVGAEVNRYVLSAMSGLEEGVPEKLRRSPEALAGQTLREYVDARPHRRSAPRNVLLIFDQFEEVLTVEPLAVAAKEEFFDQLGELLHDPRIFAIFAIREDYLAPLSPYARRVPTYLNNRFRIDLLGLDGAREAIVNPALAGGREFLAADLLVRDLATMRVQQHDGSIREQIGNHVEPVELQVVCRRLWDAMPADKRSIEAGDLERFGDVGEALRGYYADSVSRLAGGEEFRERKIREWFSEALITAEGIRGQVLRGVRESGGLANDVILRLLDTYLVRAEQHSGVTWYELAHDRLIEPVRADNAAWRAEHLSDFQQQAILWERQGRPPGLLLQDEALVTAETWAQGSVMITEVEVRFLDQSRKAQDIIERERRQAQRIKRLSIGTFVVGILALGASIFALVQMREAEEHRLVALIAEEQREDAHTQRLAVVAEALAVRSVSLRKREDRELAALLAVQAYRLNRRLSGGAKSPQIDDAMRLAVDRLDKDAVSTLLSRFRTRRSETMGSAELVAEICGTVERNLTRAEWREYLPKGTKYQKTCPNL